MEKRNTRGGGENTNAKRVVLYFVACVCCVCVCVCVCVRVWSTVRACARCSCESRDGRVRCGSGK